MKLQGLLIATALLAFPTGLIAQETADAVKNAFKAVNDQMMQEMTKPPSGNADKDFAMMMIPHHQGAIEMAKAELQYGKDKKLRAMAEKIIKAQEMEIAQLRKWQAANPLERLAATRFPHAFPLDERERSGCQGS